MTHLTLFGGFDLMTNNTVYSKNTHDSIEIYESNDLNILY